MSLPHKWRHHTCPINQSRLVHQIRTNAPCEACPSLHAPAPATRPRAYSVCAVLYCTCISQNSPMAHQRRTWMTTGMHPMMTVCGAPCPTPSQLARSRTWTGAFGAGASCQRCPGRTSQEEPAGEWEQYISKEQYVVYHNSKERYSIVEYSTTGEEVGSERLAHHHSGTCACSTLPPSLPFPSLPLVAILAKAWVPSFPHPSPVEAVQKVGCQTPGAPPQAPRKVGATNIALTVQYTFDGTAQGCVKGYESPPPRLVEYVQKVCGQLPGAPRSST